MKKTSFVLITLFVFSASLLAKGKHTGHSACMNVVNRFTRANIQLSEEQKNTILYIYDISNTKIANLSSARRVINGDIRLEISKRDVDREKLKKLIMDKKNIEGLIEFKKVNLDLDILEVLTEKQRDMMTTYRLDSRGGGGRH